MNTKEHIVLTGDRPSGCLHLGHYVGSLKQRLELQEKYKQYIIIADAQALTDNAKTPEKVRDNIIEVALDYLAVGIDPKKTTIFIQSQIPELFELTSYYLNLVSIQRLQQNPTLKKEIKQKDFLDSLFSKSTPAGFVTYPISQVADITAFKADLVPVGEDQCPMIEQTNDLVKTFNKTYKTKTLKKVKELLSETPRLSGIDGKNKMSKSLNNAIYLKDSEEDLRKKVNKIYTDPNHIKVEDKGKIEGNIAFEYLDAFDKNKEEVEKIKQQYKKGGLADTEVKNRLFNILNEELKPIREKREELSKDKKQIMEILEKGTEEARSVAQQTLKEVKEAMKINYL